VDDAVAARHVRRSLPNDSIPEPRLTKAPFILERSAIHRRLIHCKRRLELATWDQVVAQELGADQQFIVLQ
jgi:hypothetical protein